MNRSKLAIVLSSLLLGVCFNISSVEAAPTASHPRLWLTQADLPRLRTWAQPTNPMYSQGLLPALQSAIATYNNLFFPGGQPNPNWTSQVDGGTADFSPYPAEAYAEFFAFMSLVDNDPTARIVHAQRARNLLMYVINAASNGHSTGVPYSDQQFATYNRSRWWGEGFGLTVDWIYNAVDTAGNPILTAADKAKIRQVFLQWSDDNIHGYMAPPQIGANNPQLLSGGGRNAGNNYFSGHMRNMSLMALSFDTADDPPLDPSKPAGQLGNTLRSYLDNVFGVWMYQQYGYYEQPAIVQQAYNLPASYLPKLGNASGGLPAEGLLYGESLSYVEEAMLALHTAGYHDPSLAGPQIALADSAYWDRFVQGFLQSLPPATATLYSWMGPVYQPGGYGDTLRLYIEPGMSEVFAALNVFDQYTGNAGRLAQTRWILTNAIQGGVGMLFNRAGNIWGNGNASMAILHFLAFDPASAQAPTQIADPRPAWPTDFYDPAMGRQLARTDWSTNATFYGYKCSWLTINHQSADCNQFELFRRGEWLTKEHTNYDSSGIGTTTDYHNTLSLLNDKPSNLNPFELNFYPRGSQWNNGMNAGDPTVVASVGSGYAYAQGDSTNLYNRTNIWCSSCQAIDIVHASRSVVWLKPDFIVVYDRAKSKSQGRFKRFNLQLVSNPSVLGHLAVDTLSSGQQLFVQNLLPANASLTAMLDEPVGPAEGEPTQYRLVVEDASNPVNVRFLHVLQGADANQSMQAASYVKSQDGAYEGAVVNGTAVLFQSVLGQPPGSLSYIVPLNVDAQVISGLVPNASYDLQTQPDPNGTLVTLVSGSTYRADKAGVLSVNTNNLLTGLTPASLTISSAGGVGSFSVSALAGASWSAASNAPSWLTVGSGAGQGDGSVSFVAATNTSTSPRSGTISLGALSFSVTQKGMSCQPTLSSNSVYAPATNLSGTVNLSVAAGCPWTAASNVPWIVVGTPGGAGGGSVGYTVQANSGGARVGTVSIAGQIFTVNQAAATISGTSCSVSLSLARKLMAAGASTKAVVVTAPTGCAWTASSSNPSWLTVASSGGSGNATVSFSASANSTTASRTANLGIGGQTVIVTQAGNVGNGCIYAFGTDAQASYPDNTTAAHGGGSGSVPVTSPGGCPWTAVSNVPWMAVTAGASAAGNNAVQFTVAANPGAARVGTLTIAGMTYTVTQN